MNQPAPLKNQLIKKCGTLALALTATFGPWFAYAHEALISPAAVTVEYDSASALTKVYIDGYVLRATTERFRDIPGLASGQEAIVYFNSHGGDLDAAMELGQLIRERGYSAKVGIPGHDGEPDRPGYCESACPFAFAGGVFRFLDPSSQLGVHQFFKASGIANEHDLATAQFTTARLANHLSNLGIDLRLLEIAAQATPNQMSYLSPAQAYELDLVNGGSRPASWSIRAEQGVIYLLGEQVKVTGTGRFAVSCTQDRRLSVAAFYRPDHREQESGGQVSLLTDKTSTQIYDARFSSTAKNGFWYMAFTPTSEQVKLITSARTVGIQGSTQTSAHNIRFSIDVNDAGPMLESFAAFCSGSRPSLEEKLNSNY